MIDHRSPAIDDHALLAKYCATYGLTPSDVSLDQIRTHLELEHRLTEELLQSTPDDRWETFERCYTELYESLPWLAGTGASPDPERWSRVIGSPPARIFEVGSGAGALAFALAERGYEIVATDVSRKRGGERETRPGLTWQVTDGIHLAEHSEPGSYDVVISDQLIEHLHPDDVAAHFEGAFQLLKPGGKYAFRTPHSITGPHDVSLVIGAVRPIGMHLHEYTCTELEAVARSAGFSHAQSVATLAGLPKATTPSVGHLRYQRWIERQKWTRRARVARFLRGTKAPVRPDVWMVAHKSG